MTKENRVIYSEVSDIIADTQCVVRWLNKLGGCPYSDTPEYKNAVENLDTAISNLQLLLKQIEVAGVKSLNI